MSFPLTVSRQADNSIYDSLVATTAGRGRGRAEASAPRSATFGVSRQVNTTHRSPASFLRFSDGFPFAEQAILGQVQLPALAVGLMTERSLFLRGVYRGTFLLSLRVQSCLS